MKINTHGRIPKDQQLCTSLVLRMDQVKKLDELTIKYGLKRSDIIRQMIDSCLKDLEFENEYDSTSTK